VAAGGATDGQALFKPDESVAQLHGRSVSLRLVGVPEQPALLTKMQPQAGTTVPEDAKLK
jgi:hypothetical protein